MSLCGLILLTALTLTASRSGMLALGLGYLACIFVLTSSSQREVKLMAPKLLLLPCIGMLLLGVLGSSQQFSGKWLALLKGRDYVAIKSRTDVWKCFPKTVARSPLVGHGLGCFARAYQEDRPPLMAGEDYMNVAHNDYIQWIVEIGVIGLGAWLALLFGATSTAWKSYKSPTPFVASQIGSTVGIFIFCIFNPACPIPACFLWIGASLGLSYALPLAQHLDPVEEKTSHLQKAFGGACLLLCLASGYWGLTLARRVYSMEEKLAKARQLTQELNWEKALEIIDSAAADYPPSPKPLRAAAALSHKAFLFSGDRQWLQLEGTCLLGALETSPNNIEFLLDVTRYLEDQGLPDKAQRYVDKASKIAPFSPHVRKAKVRNLIFQGKLEEAATGLASLKATGLQIDDRALVELLVLLEAQALKTGKPDTIVRQTLDSMVPARRFTIAIQAAHKAKEKKLTPVAFAILNMLDTKAPNPSDSEVHNRIVVSFSKAQCLGEQGQVDQALAILDKLMLDKTVKQDLELTTAICKYWTELRLSRKEYRFVLARLDEYLLTQPQESWARLQQSKIQLALGHKSEARAALRAGVSYDTDGSLRLQIGDLCAAQGLIELARSYYEEASAYSASITAAQTRLKNLKGKASEDTETLVD